MAISYVSQVYESNPYVNPVDLNLLSTVNRYKQSLFYQNADRLKGQLNQAINLDIIKGEEKQYANQKVNNLVTQINGSGALDYSDPSLNNQIEGAIGDIYNDPNVMNAVVDTKQIRQLQSNLEKLKTDPKLSKYYSAANEWDATQPVTKYMNSGFGTRYADLGGTTAPTPYKGNVYQRLKESLKTLKPNISVQFKDGVPYYIDKETNTYVDADKVYADISAQMDGDILNQIGIDSRYSMRNYTPDQVLKTYNDSHNNKLGSLNKQLETYQKAYDSEPGTSRKQQIGEYINNIKSRLNSLQENYKDMNPKSLVGSEEGLNQLKQRVYTDDLLDKAVTANTYNQTKSDLVADQSEMFDLWKKKEEIKFSYAQKLLAQKAAATTAAKAPKDGSVIDPSLATMSYNKESDADLQATKDAHTVTGLSTQNDALEKQTSDALVNFLQTTGFQKGIEALQIDPKTNTSPILEKLYSLDGKGGTLSIDDLKQGLNALDPAKKPLLTDVQKSYVSKIVNAIDAVATGKTDPNTFNDLDIPTQKFMGLMSTMRENTMLIEANKSAIKDATTNTGILKSLSPAARSLYQDIQTGKRGDLKGAIQFGGTGILLNFAGGEELAKNYSSIGKEVNSYIGESYRRNYLSATFKDPSKLSNLQALISKSDAESGSVDAIRPLGINQKAGTTDWELQYQYKSGEDFKQKTMTITNEQASGLGLTTNPRPDVEAYFNSLKETPPIYTYSNILKEQGVFKYTIGKNTNNPNDNDFTIKFNYGNSTIPVTIGFDGQPIKSYNSAKLFAETLLGDDNITKYKANYPKLNNEQVKQKIFADLNYLYKYGKFPTE